MHILLIILKITGIVLLSILALAICLALLVLFVPVRYRADGHFGDENKKSRGEKKKRGGVDKKPGSIVLKAKWLLGIVSAEYVYSKESDDGGVKIRLFYIPVGRRKRRRTAGEDRKDKKAKRVKEARNRQEKAPGGAAGKSTGETAGRSTGERTKKDSGISDKESSGKTAGKSVGETAGKRAKKTSGRSTWRDNIRNARESAGGITGKLRAYYGILSDKENKEAFDFIKKTLRKLIKHIAPKKVRADMVIGLDDPAATGMLFGVLGIFISFVEGEYNLSPDFNEKRLDGRAYAKGRIMSVIVIYHLIRVFTNSDIKKVTGQFKEVR